MGLRDTVWTAATSEGEALSGRELDAVRLVAEGKSDWEIAVIFGISEHTARFHVDNARRKLGAVNRAHAVARLAAQGRLHPLEGEGRDARSTPATVRPPPASSAGPWRGPRPGSSPRSGRGSVR